MSARFRTVIFTSLCIAVVTFCAYSIPTYFQLLAHQPGRNPVDATSFPPGYAFVMGGIFAAIGFVLAFLLLFIVWAGVRVFRRWRESLRDGTTI